LRQRNQSRSGGLKESASQQKEIETMPEPDPRDDYLPEDEELTIDRPPPPSSFADAVREAPLVAVAAAFVAGLVVGRMIL
jgi:hypothetical protein